MKRAYAYIDGFNLYYSIKNSNYKWMNLKALVERILPDFDIIRLKYFTANVSGAVDFDAPRRQKIYFNALETIPELEIIKGNFISKYVWRRLVSFPYAGIDLTHTDGSVINLKQGVYSFPNPHTNTSEKVYVDSNPNNYKEARALKKRIFDKKFPNVYVHTNEEKGSDVNLGSHLINDAWGDCFDSAAIISADTDLIEPVRIVTQERKKEVIIIAPFGRQVEKFRAISTEIRKTREKHLMACQFPDPIILPDGTALNKPTNW